MIKSDKVSLHSKKHKDKVTGPLGKVRARKGSWVTLTQGDLVKTEYVDGDNIKEDIFYRLVYGEFQEV